MSKTTTKKAKAVTDEGFSSDLDLGKTEDLTPQHHSELDQALSDAGLASGDEETIIDETPLGEVEEVAEEEEPEELEPVAPDVEEPADVELEDDQPPAETPSEAEAAEAEAKRVQELREIDLDKVESPAGVSPRNLVNFSKLRDVAKLHRQEAEAARVEIEQLKTASPVALNEKDQAELTELRQFRRVFDTENDPEFQKEFNEKLSVTDDALMAILKKNGLPAATEISIREMGMGAVAPSFWEKQILPNLSVVEQERVKRRLAERADIAEQRDAEVQRFQSQRGEVLAEREQKSQQQFETERGEIMQHLEVVTKDVPWARRVDVSKAPAADKAKAEAHNTRVNQMEVQFHEALYPATPQARAEIAAAAVASTVLATSVQDLGQRLQASNERNKQLEADLAKIKGAGRIPGGERTSRSRSQEAVDPGKLTDDDAIEAGLAAAESAS